MVQAWVVGVQVRQDLAGGRDEAIEEEEGGEVCVSMCVCVLV